MTKRQLAALFTIDLAIFSIGGVVVALAPIYTSRLGADSTLTGFYLSAEFAAVAVGTVITGWLSDRFQRRKILLIIAGLIEIAAIWLMGQATNMPQLFAFTVVYAFLAGMQFTLVNILAGLFAEESERGRVFGIIGSAVALGGLVGGLAGGPIVDRWGFTGMFTVAALVVILQPLSGLLVQDKTLERSQTSTNTTVMRNALLSATFLLLFIASTLAFVTNAVQALGRSLVMDKLGFDAAAITSTVAAGGLIGLPFPLVVGWLSDRIGRKPLLMLCYLSSTLSLIILAVSITLWHFWVSTALQIVLGASIGVGSALVTDTTPQEALGSSLALFGATNWIGITIGFAATGASVQNIGMATTLLVGAVLAVIGAVLVIPIRRAAPALTVTSSEMLP